MNNYEHKLKLVLIGDNTVGKTTIRQSFMGHHFTGQYIKTIGADFSTKKINFKDFYIKFQIWDLAGQYNYCNVQKSFYQGSKAAILVFDLTNKNTLLNIEYWIHEALKNSLGTIKIFILVGNKKDLVRKISNKEGIDFSEKLSKELEITISYIETSAKTGENINFLFEKIAESYLINEKLLQKNKNMKTHFKDNSNKKLIRMVKNLELRISKLENKLKKITEILGL